MSFRGIEKANLKKLFAEARPFRYVVIDDFLPTMYANELREIILGIEDDQWTRYKGGKLAITEPDKFPPKVGAWVKKFNEEPHMRWLQSVCGFNEKLVPDHKFEGGGIHKSGVGARLGIHVDFNQNSQGLYRRLNTFLFLNPDWQEEWGGCLELADGSVVVENVTPSTVVKIIPKFNRFVMFESSEHSWHGHPVPISPEAPYPRLSLAIYYYQNEKPEWFEQKHSTIYRS